MNRKIIRIGKFVLISIVGFYLIMLLGHQMMDKMFGGFIIGTFILAPIILLFISLILFNKNELHIVFLVVLISCLLLNEVFQQIQIWHFNINQSYYNKDELIDRLYIQKQIQKNRSPINPEDIEIKEWKVGKIFYHNSYIDAWVYVNEDSLSYGQRLIGKKVNNKIELDFNENLKYEFFRCKDDEDFESAIYSSILFSIGSNYYYPGTLIRNNEAELFNDRYYVDDSNIYPYIDMVGSALYENGDTVNDYLIYVEIDGDTIKRYNQVEDKFNIPLKLGNKYKFGFYKKGYLPKHLIIDVIESGENKYGFEFPMEVLFLKTDSIVSSSKEVAYLRYFKETGYIENSLDSNLIRKKIDN